MDAQMKSLLHMRQTMKTLTPIIVCCIILGAARGEEICYDDIGCFSNVPPWSRTLQRLFATQPWSPENIDTQFFLLSRENLHQHQVISARNLTGLDASSFQTSRRTILVVHGLSDRAEHNWVSSICRELLLVEDVNCIGVDWRRGSGNILLYVHAANNGRVVGAEICYLLKTLQAEKNYPLSNVHIIGHSLGAHIAGEAGRRCPGIRRITGLDPAAPYYKFTEEEIRLDPTDAGFVDVIHTDTERITGFGMGKPIGHFDFYPNGGKHMAGCPSKLASVLKLKNNQSHRKVKATSRLPTAGLKCANCDVRGNLGCDHFRALLYYMDSIRSPGGYVSYPCDSYENFKSGFCFPCSPQGCPTMGHFSDLSYNISDQRRTFYLNTGENPPHFSNWRYKVSLTLTGTATTLGRMYVLFHRTEGNVTEHQLGSGFLVPGKTFSEFIDSSVMLHPLDHVTFHWTPLIYNLFQRKLGAARIDIQTGEDGTISSFCTKGTVLDKAMQVLGPCGGL